MAKFGDTAVDALPTAITPKEGVVDTSLGLVDSQMAKIIPTVGASISQGIEAFADDKKEGVLGNYGKDLAKIADSLSQGITSRKKALNLSRRLWSSYIEENPNLAGELSALHSRMLSTAGLAQIIGTTSPDEKFREARRQKAINMGLVNDDGSADMDALSRRELLDGQAKVQSQDTALLTAQITLENLRDGRISAKTKARIAASEIAQRELFIKNAAAGVKQTTHKSGLILNNFLQSRADGNVNAFKEAEAKFANLEAEVSGIALQFSGILEDTTVKLWLDTHTGIIQVYREMVGEGKETQALKDRKDNIINRAILNAFMRDSRAIKYAAASEIFKNLPPQLVPEAQLYIKSMMDATAPADKDWKENPEVYGHGNIFRNPDPKEVKTFWDVSENYMKQAGESKDPVLMKEAVNHLFGIFKHLGNINTTTLKPEAYKQMNKFISGDAFGTVMEANKGLIPEFMGEQTKNIIEGQLDGMFRVVKSAYMQKTVVEVINKGLLGQLPVFSGGRLGKLPSEDDVPFSVQRPISHSIEIGFVGASAVFKPRNPNPTEQERELADGLNSGVGKMLNISIKSLAHISGTKNYAKIWNEHFKPDFDKAPQRPTAEDEGDVDTSTVDEEGSNFLVDLIQVESGGDDTSIGSAGEIGRTQIKPSTGLKPGITGVDPIDVLTATPEERDRFTVQMVNAGIKRFGSVALGLAAYNAGHGAIAKWVKKGTGKFSDLPKTAQNYLKKFEARGAITLDEFS